MKKMILLAFGLLLLQAASAFEFNYADTLGFDKAASWSPGQILTDRISGVRVESQRTVAGSIPQVYLRGVNSLRSDSQPLWIIDGVMVDASLNGLSWLNLEDIKSIRVLKDLSAAAIYGPQAANGVIIVNTYSESAGTIGSADKFSARWSSNAGINPGFSHNHSVSLTGQSGKTTYSVSGFYRMNSCGEPSGSGQDGGARICFETSGSSVFKIGSTTNVSISGNRNDLRYDCEKQGKGGGTALYAIWNVTPSLNFRLEGGADLRNATEYLWYGNSTEEGLAHSGLSTIFGTTLVKYNARAILNWTRYFSASHRISAVASIDVNSTDTKSGSMTGTDFFSQSLGSRGIALANGTPDVSKYDFVHQTNGGFVTLGYSFKNIVGADVSLRLDRTPRFDDSYRSSKSTNAYFDIKNAFLPKSSALGTLRLTVGYGEAGWEKPVPYAMYPQYLPGSYPQIEAESEPFFEGLSRCRSAEFNAGMEIGFLKNRILFAAKYYDKRTVDSFCGFCFGEKGTYYWDYSPRKEMFSRKSLLSNKGFEFDLSADIIRGKNISWTLGANASRNVNQYLKVDPSDEAGAVLGRSVGVNTGYVLDGNGNPLDITGDGIVNIYDMVALEDAFPSVTGGLWTDFRVGRFTAGILAGAASGYYARIDRISLGYSMPVKKAAQLKALQFRLSAYPSWKGVLAGFGLDF